MTFVLGPLTTLSRFSSGHLRSWKILKIFLKGKKKKKNESSSQATHRKKFNYLSIGKNGSNSGSNTATGREIPKNPPSTHTPKYLQLGVDNTV